LGKDCNLYCYCGNGPTNRTDPSGDAWYDYLNPFWWFSTDWSGAVDHEIALLKQLNATFGTSHTSLHSFTPEERARIEAALGIEIDWDNGAIQAATESLGTRRVVLGTSEGCLWGAAAVDTAAGACAITGVNPWVGKVAIHGPHHPGMGNHLQIMVRTGEHVTRHLRIPLP